MTPQEIEALTATRQVDHPRLLRMQLQPEPGQHQAHPLSRRLDRRLRVAHDHGVSRPGESHPRALAELYVNVSAHTAPIIQPPASLNGFAWLDGSSRTRG